MSFPCFPMLKLSQMESQSRFSGRCSVRVKNLLAVVLYITVFVSATARPAEAPPPPASRTSDHGGVHHGHGPRRTRSLQGSPRPSALEWGARSSALEGAAAYHSDHSAYVPLHASTDAAFPKGKSRKGIPAIDYLQESFWNGESSMLRLAGVDHVNISRPSIMFEPAFSWSSTRISARRESGTARKQISFQDALARTTEGAAGTAGEQYSTRRGPQQSATSAARSRRTDKTPPTIDWVVSFRMKKRGPAAVWASLLYFWTPGRAATSPARENDRPPILLLERGKKREADLAQCLLQTKFPPRIRWIADLDALASHPKLPFLGHFRKNVIRLMLMWLSDSKHVHIEEKNWDRHSSWTCKVSSGSE